MSTSHFCRMMIGASLTGLALSSLSAQAQTQDEGVSAPEEIIVTARRKDERLQDVPTAINAVTSDAIEKLNLREFKDIQSVVPGLQLTTAPNGFSTGATVRGIKADVEAAGTNPSVEFYLNDAPIPSNGLFAAMYDVGQVELLRGPQGTLRGRAAPSGSITVTTRKPNLEEFGGYVTSTFNDIGGINVNGAVGMPVIKDVLAVRVAGYTDKSELNRVTSFNSGASPVSHTDSYRISARLEPSDYLAVNVSYQNTVRKLRSFDQVQSISLVDSSYAASNPFIYPTDRRAIADGYRSARQKFDQFNWSADLRLGGQKLSYVGSHSIQDFRAMTPKDLANTLAPTASRALVDVAGTEGVCAANQTLFGIDATNGDFYNCIHTHTAQDSHELRLASEERVLGMFSYVIGGFINHYSTPSALTQESANSNGTFSQSGILRGGRSTEKSVFGNVTAFIGDRTELSGGLRFINYKDESTLMVSGRLLSATADKANTTVYTASLKHNFSDDVMAYANVGSSWRPGIRAVGDFSRVQTPLEQSFLNIAAEKSTSYEIGVKTAFLNRRGIFNISAFHQDFTNYGYRAPGQGVWYINYLTATLPQAQQFNFVSAVPVKVDGIEAEASFKISRHWNIGGNFSYARSRVKNGLIPCTDLNGDGIPDSRIGVVTVGQLPAGDHLASCRYNGPASEAPEWQAVIQSEYARPITGNVDGYLRGLLNIYPSYKQDIYNLYDDVKSYTLLNLYAGIRAANGQWELSVFGKNIFNTQRVLTTGTGPQATSISTSQISSSTVTANYLLVGTTAPREFGVNLRYAFGSR